VAAGERLVSCWTDGPDLTVTKVDDGDARKGVEGKVAWAVLRSLVGSLDLWSRLK
jgi:hypothetical protein